MDATRAESGKTGQIPAHDIHHGDGRLRRLSRSRRSRRAITVTSRPNWRSTRSGSTVRRRMGGFVLLVNDARKDKVGTASFQSLTFGDTTFYAVGPFRTAHDHERSPRLRCECHHERERDVAYNETGDHGRDQVETMRKRSWSSRTPGSSLHRRIGRMHGSSTSSGSWATLRIRSIHRLTSRSGSS